MGEGPQDPFSKACGLSGSLRVRLEGMGADGRPPLEFQHPFLIVGRDCRADVAVDDVAVSRRHAYFQAIAGRVFCVDLGSRTGVHWGGTSRPVGWVDQGEGVGIGPASIRFEGDGAGQGGSLPISRSFEWPSLTDASLEFLDGGQGRETWQVSRALVLIGRSPTCRARLEDPKIAGIHAALVRTPHGVWVVDLLGPGGILVGGTPTRSARLEDGDQIGLGNHRIRVRIGRGAGTSGRSDLARRESGRGLRRASKLSGPAGSLGVRGKGDIEPRGDSGAMADASTARLLDEFDRMHQRTSDQFQQAILMMFRMHQDQMEVIRGELSRLDRLDDEMRALQSELSRGNSPPPPRVTLRLVAGEAVNSPPQPDEASPALKSSRLGEKGPLAAPAARVRGEDPTHPLLPVLKASDGPPSHQDIDAHTRLSRKLAEIQDERQGLWKKLLGSLTGGESGRVLP